MPTHLARYAVVEAELSAGGLTPIGVLIEDVGAGQLYQRFRRDLDRLAEAPEREVLEALADDLERKASPGDLGADGLLSYLEGTLSNFLRITDRREIEIENFDVALNRLYRQNVQSNVVPFRTHLPLYSLRVAAGKFLENEEVSEESWIETPAGLRLEPNMFLARVTGRSMEPSIPDGSLCVFRHGVVGSRQGRLVLVENLEITGNNRYTVKRYSSEKAGSRTEGEPWKHARIHLQSLNPEFPSWDLDPDEEKYRIVAEFVRVLE